MLKYLLAFLMIIGLVIATQAYADSMQCAIDPLNHKQYHCAYALAYNPTKQMFNCTVWENQSNYVTLISNVALDNSGDKMIITNVRMFNGYYFLPAFLSSGSAYIDIYIQLSPKTGANEPVIECFRGKGLYNGLPRAPWSL